MIQVAILGHGVVGSGVAEVLRKNAAGIAHKAGDAIEIKRILDLREFPETPYADLFTKNFDDILHDADIRIVVETMGGLHPAYEFVKSCLQAGKSVVTSNKELVAAPAARSPFCPHWSAAIRSTPRTSPPEASGTSRWPMWPLRRSWAVSSSSLPG